MSKKTVNVRQPGTNLTPAQQKDVDYFLTGPTDRELLQRVNREDGEPWAEYIDKPYDLPHGTIYAVFRLVELRTVKITRSTSLIQVVTVPQKD